MPYDEWFNRNCKKSENAQQAGSALKSSTAQQASGSAHNPTIQQAFGSAKKSHHKHNKIIFWFKKIISKYSK